MMVFMRVDLQMSEAELKEALIEVQLYGSIQYTSTDLHLVQFSFDFARKF